MMLALKTAQPGDIETVAAIFRRAIIDMDAKGIFQWDEIYPSKADLRGDIDNKEMFLICNDELIVGVVVLNNRLDEEYAQGDWFFEEPAAVHRLCIDPVCQQKGYGRQAIGLAEVSLKERGFQSVRLDAFSQNPYALRLYESLGYRRAGEVHYRKGLFYLYEKSLL